MTTFFQQSPLLLCQNLSKTLQDALESACGPWGRRLTSLCVAVYCFGTTITFLIIIGDQFDRFEGAAENNVAPSCCSPVPLFSLRALASLYGHSFCFVWYLSRTFTMPLSSLMFILPLCYSKRIDFLKLPSAVGVLAIFYIGKKKKKLFRQQPSSTVHS